MHVRDLEFRLRSESLSQSLVLSYPDVGTTERLASSGQLD